MIAHVAPLRRMPRRMDYFDYQIPSSMQIARGDLVRIPVRAQSLLGIVIHVHEGPSPTSLKPIQELVKQRYFDESAMQMIEWTSRSLVQSMATICREVQAARTAKEKKGAMSIGPAPSLHKNEVPAMQAMLQYIQDQSSGFIQVHDEAQMIALVELIRKRIQTRLQIFVPTHHLRTHFWGSMTRQGAIRFDNHADLTLVLHSQAEEYASYNRNPRYDARELLLEERRLRGGKIFFVDFCPQVSDFHRFSTTKLLDAGTTTQGTLIDLQEAHKQGIHALISPPVQKAIEERLSAQRSALLLYNKKGVQSSLRCRSCHYQPRCGSCGSTPTVYGDHLACHHCGITSPLFDQCPKCHKSTLTARGVGNQQIVSYLQTLFPDTPVIRIEKGANDSVPSSPCIIVATDYYLDQVFDPRQSPRFGLVANLLADLGLSDPSFLSSERVLHRLYFLEGLAFRNRAQFLIRTYDLPLTGSFLHEPQNWLAQESQTRKSINLPPFGKLYRLTCKGTQDCAKVKTLLESKLAGLKIHQFKLKNKDHLEIILPLNHEGNLRSILKELPDDVIISTIDN